MAHRKTRKPDVSTYADHEVITPPHELAKAIARGSAADTEDDAVARAEQALSKLSSEFTGWMDEESERLNRARNALQECGAEKEALQALYRAAHDIKGEAATFGYPLVTPVAESLCRMIDQASDPSCIPFMLVDQHVSAIRAIVREYARPDIEKLTQDLADRLRVATEEILSKAETNSPSLAPIE